MQVTKLSDARPYDAKLHWGMTGLRLQGMDATDLKSFSCSLSYLCRAAELNGGRLRMKKHT